MHQSALFDGRAASGKLIPTNPNRAFALHVCHVGTHGSRDARRLTIARRVVAGSLVVGLLILSSGAAAKDFNPGDLSACNAKLCVSIRSQSVLSVLSSFYYDTAKPPARTDAPRLGAPFFRLEFSNGYVTGIVAGTRLDRFLSYGVNLDQFRKAAWYRVPTRAAAGLRSLTVALTPFRLTGAALAGTYTFGVQVPGAQPRLGGLRPTDAGGHGNGLRWPVVLVPLAALIALASFWRRLRSGAGQPPVLGRR